MVYSQVECLPPMLSCVNDNGWGAKPVMDNVYKDLFVQSFDLTKKQRDCNLSRPYHYALPRVLMQE